MRALSIAHVDDIDIHLRTDVDGPRQTRSRLHRVDTVVADYHCNDLKNAVFRSYLFEKFEN